MEAKIISVEENGDNLRVLVQHEYGVDNIGISKNLEEYDHISGQPKWIIEVKQLLEKKYKNAKKPDKKQFIGTTIDVKTE